jgi:hypothetical protein
MKTILLRTISPRSFFTIFLCLASCNLLQERRSYDAVDLDKMPGDALLLAEKKLKTLPQDWNITKMNQSAGSLADLVFVTSESKSADALVFWINKGKWLALNGDAQIRIDLLEKKFSRNIRLISFDSDPATLTKFCRIICIAVNGHRGTTLSDSMRGENIAPWLHGRNKNKFLFLRYCVDPILSSAGQGNLKLEWNQIRHDGSIERWTIVFTSSTAPKILELRSVRKENSGTFSWGLVG